jgi:hypothetical protein
LSLCIANGTFSWFGIEITLGVDDLQINKHKIKKMVIDENINFDM